MKGLPEALQRQFEYEDPIVRGGKQLLHSPFFKVMFDLFLKRWSIALRLGEPPGAVMVVWLFGSSPYYFRRVI